MPAYDRDAVDSGRQSVPMWDSSDPDRAPPPLPIPPGSPGLATRSNASANIQATAQRLTERARDSMPASAYTTNPAPSSPDKSLIKGAHHRRMQSLQTSSVRDLRTYLDGMRNGSPERPTSRSTATPSGSPTRPSEGDYFSSPPRDHSTPTPAGRDALRDAPALRPSASRPRGILGGENTPPSATMLALQTMAARDPDSSLHDVTNSTPVREPKTLHDMMAQLANITNITSGMQKEMAQLNRRSKDNAADLIGLKQAADSRDEEIRRNLRDLLTNVSASEAGSVFGGRSSAFGLGLLENRGLTSPPAGGKPFSSLPRSNSHGSFLDPGSPNPFSMDGAASVAMLEKIIREMVTKDGQDRLLSTLSELLDKHSRDNVQAIETAQKVAELSDFIKEKSGSHALVRHSSDAQDDEQKSKAIEAMSADILRLLHKIKDSTSQSGGLSNEIKALLQNLRGEVLGMGRELGRQLDQANSTARVAEDGSQTKADMEQIVNQGLIQLREHMENMIQQNSQQLVMAGQDENKSREMYDIVKSAITEHSSALVQAQPQSEGLDRASILEAVKDAIEEFRPEIELQQFGLERDEILQVLKQGLVDYQENKEPSAAPGAPIEEVEAAMQRALQDFSPPRPADEMVSFKEDLLTSIRQSIEELKSAGPDSDATHAIVLGAVREGLENHGPHAPREFEISRDDLFDAVKASLDGSTLPFGSFGEQVLDQLRNLIEEMKVEFKQYSAANGRDTEQVLDAIKDGLETLRNEVESYVDRAQDVTGKDEIVDVVRTGLEQLRGDVQSYCAEGPSNGRNEMIDYIKAEFEHLHEAVSGLGSREGEEGRPSSTSEILVALEAGFAELKTQTASRGLLDETNEEVLEAMKAEFETLRDAVIAGSNTNKAEVIETIQESLDALHNKVGTREDGTSDNDLLLSMKDELAHLRETLAATLLKSGAAAERDEMIETIREAVDTIRMQVSSEQGEANAETLAALKEHLENFRDSTTKGLVLSNGETDEEPSQAPLDEIRTRLDEIAAASSGSGVNTALLEAIQGEFQQIRQSLGSGNSRADTEEVLDAVRLGLDDLQSSLEKKIDNPEMHRTLNNELMDTLNEGLDSMRTDVAKIMDKPVDMTVNYEILETLKEGVASLRADMEKLTGGDRSSTALGSELILADAPGEEGSRELGEEEKAAPSVSLKERMEALFAQLHIKVEGLAASIGDMPAASAAPAEGIALKEDLIAMEETLRNIQDALVVMAEKERAEPENAVTKEDTDAIETLLRNTKAQLEELPATSASREQLDGVEAVVRSAKEAIDGLATKEDVAVVEVLVKDLATAFETSKPKAAEEEEEEEAAPHLTQGDLDALGMLCTEIKEKISELNLPDPEALPSKADVEQITGLINDFRESHDKVREGYENDIAVTAKAFDDRRKEAEEMAEAISGVKTFLEEVKAEILAKVEEGTPGMAALEESLKSMDDKVTGDEGIGADVKELLETVKNEFERSHESLGGIKIDHEQSSSTLLEKHAEHKDAIVAAVTEKVDSCFDGLMSKYDDAQAAAHDKAKTMEEQVEQQKEMLTSTKEMTDELKLSIDTLGTSLTAFIPSFNEATEKISEDSKTVFEKVEGAMLKMDEHNDGLKTEHQTTRDEVVKVMEAIALLQGDFGEYNPQFSMSLKELHALVSAHYEHSQQLAATAEEQAKAVQEQIRAATEESKTHVEGLFAENLKNHFSENLNAQTEELKGALPALLPAPVEAVDKYDDTAVHEKLDQLVNDTAVHEKLDQLVNDTTVHEKLDQIVNDTTVHEKLDQLVNDTAVHEKLDTLVNLAGEAGAATAQMERLDEIHAQVKATAAEVSAFVAIQQKQITDGQETKEREAEELALLLERRQVQKDNIESDISSLNEEKESLQAVVEALRAEKDALAAQKARLNADVSSLHTALEIRREELHNMDAKADALEHRILEGLIDHSRAMLLTQKTPKTSPKKKPMRDLRLPSDASTTHLPAPTTPSILKNHAMAMKTRSIPKKTGTTPNTGERRIFSLGQISGNVPSGAAAYAAAAPSLVPTQGSINRTQSLKHNKLRKISWGTARDAAADKENGALEEVTEIESNYGGSRPVSRDSEYRPQSRGYDSRPQSRGYDSRPQSRDYDSRPVSRDSLDSSVYTSSRRSVSYAGSQSPWTESNAGMTDDGRRTSYGTLGTYDTGSYLTGSDIDRRTSFGSTIRSTLGHRSAIEEEEDDDDASDVESERHVEPETPALPIETEAAAAKDVVPYAPPSDSGLGSDLPTAALQGNGDYFAGAVIPTTVDEDKAA